MPFQHYGVLVGTLSSHSRDQPDTQGRWYHVNLRVTAPLGSYRCAVDVDSKQSAVGVQWKLLTVAKAMVSPVGGLAIGYHALLHRQSAGALDHTRHPSLVDNPGCLPRRPWVSGSNVAASTALESILVVGQKAFVWGEPFSTGLGVHNIHQNQGDPAGSQWWAENGTWQDGGTMIERPDGAFDAFISKFSTQASRTDEDGHPA